jgi:xanthine dehydrogenase accessory factor
MEIYIEPYLPAPQLLVCGASPAAEALVKIGAAVGFKVILIDPSATEEKFSAAEMVLPRIEPEKLASTRERYAVVATNGNWDEEAIKTLATDPNYLGLVPARRDSSRYAKIFGTVELRRKNSIWSSVRLGSTCRRGHFQRWR